jgi:hypothetical protein
MDFGWKIFDTVAEAIGPFGAVALFAIVLAGGIYWFMSGPR